MNSHLVAEPCKLLVSFLDADEVASVSEQLADVDVLDLKNPSNGPLGRPELSIALEFAEKTESDPHLRLRRKSIALGELNEWEAVSTQIVSPWLELIRRFDYAKFGLSGMRGSDRWPKLLLEWQNALGHSTQVVPVVYADDSQADSPSMEQVLPVAIELAQTWSHLVETASSAGRRFAILVDTFVKPTDGGLVFSSTPLRLMELWTADEIELWAQKCEQHDFDFFVAGSLRLKDVELLKSIGVHAIGLRGALCCNDDRISRVDPGKVRDLTSVVKQNLAR